MTEKLYDKNAYRKIFSARVMKCEQKNGKWQVVLDRTAFYPEGGGQPSDTGVLNFVNVLDVQEHGDEIIHTTDKPLPVGLTVMGGVNWTRRFHLMQQHTGEHIVSGIANRLFGVDNVGFHMSEKFMTVDWNAQLSEYQLKIVEDLANEAVYRNVPVYAEYPSQEKLQTLSYRSKKQLRGAVRIVTVEGYDVCACCGTHVARTGEIGSVKIIDSQNYKGGTRITLVCGAQAMEDYNERLKNVSAVSALLSAKPGEIASAAERLLKENADLKRRLSEMTAAMLEQKAATVPESCGNYCTLEENLSPDDLRRYALMLAERCGGTVGVFSGKESSFRYALAVSEGDVRPFCKELNAAFGGRGGGSAELAQGSLNGEFAEIQKFFSENL